MIDNNTLTKPDKLETEKIPKLLFSFFLTTFAGLMLNSIYNLTDTLFVSWGVGDIAMGGVSIVFPFVLIQGAISTMIGGGAASLVSRKLGEGDAEGAGNITRNAMILFYIISATITVIGLIFINPLLRIMGATGELFGYAKDYFVIILIGNVFSTGFSALIRAEGKMLYSMMTWVIPITINIVLDALFILVFKWGIRGSAAATVIGQFFGFLMSMFFFFRISKQKYKNSKLKWATIGRIINIGLPSLVQMVSLSITTLILNVLIGKINGASGVVVFGYISKLITYSIAPIIAITQALSPIVGYNYGLKRNDRVRDTVKFCIIISIVYALCVILLAEIIPHYLIRIFTKDAAIIATGSSGIRIIAISILLTPLPMIIGAKMQAIGKTGWAMVMCGSNLIFIILPAILLGNKFGLKGIWWAYVISWFCSALLVIIKLVFDKFNRRIANMEHNHINI